MILQTRKGFVYQNGIKVKGMGNGKSVHSLIYDNRVLVIGCSLGLCMYSTGTGSPLVLQADVNTHTAL